MMQKLLNPGRRRARDGIAIRPTTPRKFSVLRMSLACMALSLVLASATGVASAAEEEDGEAPAAEQELQQIDVETIDAWTFGGGSMARLAAMNHADRALETRLRLLNQSVALSTGQREKLALAGRGDIVGFFGEVDAVRRACPRHQIAQDEVMAYFEHCRGLQARWAEGLHGKSSLFLKTVRTALSAEQTARLDAARKEARERQHEYRIEELLQFLELRISLSEQQQSQVEELLAARTRVDLVEGSFKADAASFARSLGEIPEEAWKPIFPGENWARVKRLVDRYRRQTVPQEE
jgi:hypothetical protein